MSCYRWLLYALLVAPIGWAWGGEGASLPEPLTLEAALALVDEAHPRLLRASAEFDVASAELRSTEAESDARLTLEGRALWIDPPQTATDPSHNDSSAHLRLRKPLYDFGRSDYGEAAGQAAVEAAELELKWAHSRQRIEVIERYLEVLLADLENGRDNEAMAVAYVTLDKLRDRNELGQVSDIELLETESRYQQSRRRYAASGARQRATRALLAEALNRPGQLPSSVVEPSLGDGGRELPPLEQLGERLEQDNPRLAALRKGLEAARQRLERARVGWRPTLEGEMEGNLYNRESGSRDPWRAGVVLEVPLYSGDRVGAEVAKAQAELQRLQADYAAEQHRLRQHLLELWQEIGVLRLQREEAQALSDYRDLYLDRSRALYELEVKSDLGDAMVEFSAARLRRAETEYALLLAWARLDGLLGGVSDGRGQVQ